jgi:hypothetical protein
MAITIDSAFIEQYKANVIQLAQQQESKLRSTIMQESSGAEFYNWDRLAPTDAEAKTGRRQETSDYYIDDAWDRRVSTPSTFVHLMTIEHEDKVQMLIDPDSAYAVNQAMAMNRSWDDQIIAAATGDVMVGDHTTITFASANQTIGTGIIPIDFDSITAVQEKFLENEIDLSVPKVAVIGPTQVRKLMQLTEQTSADYVTREALQKLSSTGIVANWMGFTWICSTRLLAPGVGELSCLFYTQEAIGLCINQDVFTRIGENPDKLYMIQVFAQYTAGAARVEDEKIVELHVLDSL